MELQNELSGISRREKLCRIIREKGQITARQAAELFGVSDMTVRRDFHLLEQQGIVSLFHGGARIRPYGGGFQGYFDRKEKLYPAKRAIASAAAEFISENDDAAFQNLEKAMTNWNDIKETTAVFASHSSVDELDEQLTELYAMAQGGSDGKIPKIKLCLLKIQNLCDDEKFSVKALF